jgi:hypothetical protein
VRAFLAVCGSSVVVLATVTATAGQQGYTHGLNVAPAFEGWERNPDDSFDMVFGFFNRNCREVLHIPIGPGNSIEPGGPDRGQPTSLLPGRGKFIFRVRVAPDFGKNELVWTLTAHGKTEKAYATLRQEYILDKRIIMMNEASYGQRFGEGDNQYPVLNVDGDTRRVKVGEPLPLSASASDDGLPHPRKDRNSTSGPALVAGWFLYRGSLEQVTFDREHVNPDFRTRDTRCPGASPAPEAPALPPSGTFTVTPTFKEPGTYVLRALVRDRALKTTRDVTVTVNK